MRKRDDRDGAHYLKLQCPARSSSAEAVIDESALELICLALHYTCAMGNVSDDSSHKAF